MRRLMALLVLICALISGPNWVEAQGTPIASPAASPVAKCITDLLAMTVDGTDTPAPTASPGPTPTPMLQASAGEASAVSRPIRNLLRCATLGTPEALALLRAILPAGPAPDWLPDLREASSIEVLSIGNIRGHGSGLSIAEVAWRIGNAERLEEWTLYRDDVSWQIRQIIPLPTFLVYAAAGMDVRIDADGLTAARPTIANPGRIIIRLRNTTAQPVTGAALLVPADATIDPLAISAPPGAKYAGDIALAPGAEADLTIVGIPADVTRLAVLTWHQDLAGNLVAASVEITISHA